MSIMSKIFGPMDRRVENHGLVATVKELINNSTKLKVKGISKKTKKVLKGNGVIVVANHTFESDPVFLLSALIDRPDLYMIVEAGFLGLGKHIDKHLIPVHIGHHQEIKNLSGWRSRMLNIIRKQKYLSVLESREKNIESIHKAAFIVKAGGLIIIFPSAAVKSGKWFSGIGHLMNQIGKETKTKIILVHIKGPSRWDYLRIIPGLGKLLREIHITFSEVWDIKDNWRQEPKEMAYALEKKYNNWVNKST